MMFADVHEAHRAYESRAGRPAGQGEGPHRRIRQIVDGKPAPKKIRIVDTTVGRALLSEILPKGMSFDVVNPDMTKKAISGLINLALPHAGPEGDRGLRRPADVHGLPVRHALRHVLRHRRHRDPGAEGQDRRQAADAEVKEIQDQYASGLVTNGERYNKVVDIWSRANDQVAKAMMEKLGTEEVDRLPAARSSARSRSTPSS